MSKELIHSASFVKSSVETDKCPPPIYPEFAFIGRSNVGKSSLINMLVNKKVLRKLRLALEKLRPSITSSLMKKRILGTWSIFQDMAMQRLPKVKETSGAVLFEITSTKERT